MDKATTEELSKIGRFIQTYSSFLSSFVIGVAGLVATSIWQYRQSQTAAETARSEQTIARTKADNDWRIARAEILSKNLNVLSTQGPNTADQRFGVLLSLTRGNIIDPELAVSYALELGRDNAGYMRAVLASTTNKNYMQLAEAFKLTCLQRFGVQRAAEICKDDKLADRSDSIAQLIQDETQAAADAGFAQAGPMVLLRNEREVQAHPGRLAWLFEPVLQDLYERRQWKEIAKFEETSSGAHLVGSLVLATARTGELLSSSEAAALQKFHSDQRQWLVTYLGSNSCDPECRGKLVDVMLSSYGEAQGDYDDPMKKLLHQPRAEAGPSLATFHSRILWCQVDADDLMEFRDRVLVPAATEAVADGKSAPTMVDDIVALVALVPEPTASGDPKSLAAWKALIATLAKSNEHIQRIFSSRRSTAQRERTNPPPMIKKVNFCGAADTALAVPKMDQ
ncbi:MAG: hypothetical protein QOI66_2835 [Myxococcales bacterium]|jgi:hypothetical protein|nr:hypothetical protein [Myxococcales bacterium]